MKSFKLLVSIFILSSGPLNAHALAEVLEIDERTFRREFQQETIDVNGIRMHYVSGGVGDTVVLIHGWPQNWYAWRKVMPSLAQDFKVVAVDLRGIGKSTTTGAGYDKKTLAEDIHALVETINLGPIHIVGHDMGGMVAHAYGVLYPDETKSVTIAEILLPGVDPNWQKFALILWHWPFHLIPTLPEGLIHGRQDIYFSNFFDRNGERPSPFSGKAVSEFVGAYRFQSSLSAGFGLYRTMEADAAFIKSALLPTNQPVLLIGGEQASGFVMPQLKQGMEKLGYTNVRYLIHRGGSGNLHS